MATPKPGPGGRGVAVAPAALDEHLDLAPVVAVADVTGAAQDRRAGR